MIVWIDPKSLSPERRWVLDGDLVNLWTREQIAKGSKDAKD